MDENQNPVVMVAQGVAFSIYFEKVSPPVPGSGVQITATLTRTVEKEGHPDLSCFTMIVTECKTLGQAQGANGGRLMFVTASSLNVRSEPDSSKENKVGLLSKGTMVEVLETGLGANGNWCKITFDCPQGYAFISMTYVSETMP